MVFSSTIFIFGFLPAVLIIYFLIPEKLKNSFLFFSSLIFYFWGENYLVWILIFSTLINYFCSLIISKEFSRNKNEDNNSRIKKTWVQNLFFVIAVIINIGFLCYYKYYTFFLDNVSAFSEFAFNSGFFVKKIALPLGISFYTFQALSYTIDVYRGHVRATKNYINFACYVTMFPQLVAGPIVRYIDIEKQLANRKISLNNFSKGINRFIFGLAKKVLIANVVGACADNIFSLSSAELTMPLSWLGIICYSLQIFFDFSGYSDMAIGMGHMLGFTFLENFNYPYISKSIKEFWQRWHISLSTWFKDYLYIPLGGNRKGKSVTYRNLIIVFLLCGFWHGASWNFVIWGMFHGLFLVAERIGLSNILKRIPVFFQRVYMLLVVMTGWVFFRSENLAYALFYLKRMLRFYDLFDIIGSLRIVRVYLTNDILIALIAGIIFSTPIINFLGKHYSTFALRCKKNTSSVLIHLKHNYEIISIAGLFILSILSIVSNTFNPFLYFRF